MKKSLVALAVAGAFAAPAAMAEVTLSGSIAVGVDIARSSAGSAPGAQSLSSQTLSVGYTNFAISSVDDIGNGNRVEVYLQVIDDISGAGANGPLQNRNSYIGLAGDWGALRLGTNENGYERMFYSHNYQDAAWGPSNISIMGNGPGKVGLPGSAWERTSETVMYYSPNWSGFSFEIDYALPGSGKADPATGQPNGLSPHVLSIAGEYKPQDMPWRAYAAYQDMKDKFGLNSYFGATGTTGSKDHLALIGGGVTFGDLMVDLILERAEWKNDDGAVTKAKRDAFDIEAKYTLPTGHIGVSFVVAKDPKVTDGTGEHDIDAGAKSFAIGYWHTLSKQSSLFTIYGLVDNDSLADYRSGSFSPATGPGRDQQNFIVGIKHVF